MPRCKLSREQLKSSLRRPAPKYNVYRLPMGWVYHCKLHVFNPDSNTVQTKCLLRNCKHLMCKRASQKGGGSIVKTLQEAIDIKNRLGDLVWIEQVEGGYRIIKRRN